MDDLISRQAAISFIENVPYIKGHPNMGDLIKEWLEQIPAVQPEKKIGQWLINSDGYYPYCSVCHNVQVNGKMTNYCPECGAYMKGESNEQTASN